MTMSSHRSMRVAFVSTGSSDKGASVHRSYRVELTVERGALVREPAQCLDLLASMLLEPDPHPTISRSQAVTSRKELRDRSGTEPDRRHP